MLANFCLPIENAQIIFRVALKEELIKLTAITLSLCKYTRFIQKVPRLGGYLKKLTSFHPDISYAHFSSQYDLINALLYHFTSILFLNQKFDARSTLKIRHF